MREKDEQEQLFVAFYFTVVLLQVPLKPFRIMAGPDLQMDLESPSQHRSDMSFTSTLFSNIWSNRLLLKYSTNL